MKWFILALVFGTAVCVTWEYMTTGWKYEGWPFIALMWCCGWGCIMYKQERDR